VDLLLQLFRNNGDEFTHGAWQLHPLGSSLIGY
jgi:hypothetical protein